MSPKKSLLSTRGVLLTVLTLVVFILCVYASWNFESTYFAPLPPPPAAAEPTVTVAGSGGNGALTSLPLPVREPSSSRAAPANATPCFQMPSFPMSGLERELDRIYRVSEAVMAELNATFWPTDATLLGMARNGRIATDRDIDFQIHATYAGCAALLRSLRGAFTKRVGRLKYFKVAQINHPTHGRIGRYAMVRMYREHGTFDTGPDFNCVYTDNINPGELTMHVHSGRLVTLPPTLFPLGKCSLYGRSVPCPQDPIALLQLFKPKYDGCLIFPHCVGNPTVSVKECLSPHPDLPMQSYMDTTQKLKACGFVNIAYHFAQEPSCGPILRGETRKCKKVVGGETICFFQTYHA